MYDLHILSGIHSFQTVYDLHILSEEWMPELSQSLVSTIQIYGTTLDSY